MSEYVGRYRGAPPAWRGGAPASRAGTRREVVESEKWTGRRAGRGGTQTEIIVLCILHGTPRWCTWREAEPILVLTRAWGGQFCTRMRSLEMNALEHLRNLRHYLRYPSISVATVLQSGRHTCEIHLCHTHWHAISLNIEESHALRRCTQHTQCWYAGDAGTSARQFSMMTYMCTYKYKITAQ